MLDKSKSFLQIEKEYLANLPKRFAWSRVLSWQANCPRVTNKFSFRGNLTGKFALLETQ